MMSYSSSLQFSEAADVDNDPDYVYYNATIINNKSQAFDTVADPPIRFQETRDVPIVKDASKYAFSIVRFTMNGANKDLPLFIPVIRTGAANPSNNVNLTIYSVSIEMDVNYTGVGSTTFSSTQPLIWTTETQGSQAPVPIPETCQSGQDITTRYYWCYTYSHWIRIANAALAAAFTDIQAQFATWWTASGGSGPAPALKTLPPMLTFNPDNNLFSIYADQYGFGGADRTSRGTATDESARLFFNNNMFGLFSNFDNVYVNNGEKTNQIIIRSILYSNVFAPIDPPAGSPYIGKVFWVMVQDYESTSTLWSPIESIVFTSALLPLVFEQTGDPITFGTSNDSATNSGRPAFQPIITDVALTNENANSYRSFILYSPTAEYRLASFQRSKAAIYNIDIQVYWKNRLDGKLYPISMFNCSSVSCKIMLRRRTATV